MLITYEDLKVVPKGLAEISQGRDIVSVKEVSKATNISTQTIRKHLSLKGNFYGITPIRLGNRLHFSVLELAKLLGGKHD